MICFPNAKINLGLDIVSKRPDGYHNIETVFYPIPVKDALEVVQSNESTFIQSGIPVDGPAEKNLVIKALNLLKSQYDIPPLEVRLLKNIPFGAGLGGGSADAACMLKLINEFCSLRIPEEHLELMASTLGADCPLQDYHLCLIKPDISVSTPEAYSLVKPAQPIVSLKKIIEMPVEEWREVMFNAFEKSVFAKQPVIIALINALYEEGAVYASMSGSGSSVFGLFKKPTNLKDQFTSCFVWEGKLQ